MFPDYLTFLVAFESFWSIWFWVLLAVSWSVASHWTLGVPFDLVIQAERRGGLHAEHCDILAQINVHRLTTLFRDYGVAVVTLAGFVLGAVATIGVLADLEVARAAFALMMPHAIAGLFSVRAAFWIEAQGLTGQPLRRAIKRQRFWTQFIGFWGILLCAVFAFYEALVFYGEL